MNWNDFYEQYAMVIILLAGIIIGDIIAFVTMYFYKNIGKSKFYFYGFRFTAFKKNEMGEFERVGSLDKADFCEYYFNADIYNSREIYKGIRDLEVRIKSSKGRAYSRPENIERVINLPPKNFISVTIKGILENKDLNAVDGKFKIFLTGKYENKKSIKIRAIKNYIADFS